jgi:hypothetical protein
LKAGQRSPRRSSAFKTARARVTEFLTESAGCPPNVGAMAARHCPGDGAVLLKSHTALTHARRQIASRTTRCCDEAAHELIQSRGLETRLSPTSGLESRSGQAGCRLSALQTDRRKPPRCQRAAPNHLRKHRQGARPKTR